MNAEAIRDYCLSLGDVSESFPFDAETLVFKTAGKMFLLLSLDESPLRINVKCNPERALHLRERHSCVLPGYHMNKKHWNTIIIDGTFSSEEIQQEISHSYELIRQTKSKNKER